jgi:hypothetical protein
LPTPPIPIPIPDAALLMRLRIRQVLLPRRSAASATWVAPPSPWA